MALAGMPMKKTLSPGMNDFGAVKALDGNLALLVDVGLIDITDKEEAQPLELLSCRDASIFGVGPTVVRIAPLGWTLGDPQGAAHLIDEV